MGISQAVFRIPGILGGDVTPPTCVLTTAAPDPVLTATFTVTATFSEDVFGFTVGDITVTNGAASGFIAASASVYTFTITPVTASLAITVQVGAGVCVDGAGNPNTASNTISRDWEYAIPYMESVIDAGDGRLMWDFQEPSGAVAVAYNSPLALGRDLVINGDFANWTGDDPDNWTVAGEVGADPEVSEVGSGQSHGGVGTGACNLFSSATAVSPQIRGEALLAVGKTYKITIVISAIAGTITLRELGGGELVEVIASTGTFNFTWTASVTAIQVQGTSAAVNATIDSITIQQTGILASSAYPGAEELSEAGDGTADKDNWTAGNNATLTNPSPNLLRIARSTTDNPNANQNALTVGKRYKMTGEARSDSNATPRILQGVAIVFAGTTSVDWQTINIEFVANTNIGIGLQSLTSTGTEHTEWRNLSITEVNPLNTDHTGVTAGQPGPAGLLSVLYAPGAYTDAYSAEHNSMFNPALWTQDIFGKVSGAGVWTDNTLRILLNWQVDANNYLRLSKNTSNELQWDYMAGGTLESVVLAVTPSDFFGMRATINATGNMTAYYNGVITGSAQAIAGTWVGNLHPDTTTIGALNTTPNSEWDGWITVIPGLPIEDTAANALTLNQVMGTA